jgi:hypothetical protein
MRTLYSDIGNERERERVAAAVRSEEESCS